MLANFLIGLREGLEAALIVGILAAYLVKLDQRSRLRSLFIGVAAAVASSIVLGLVLSLLVDQVPAGTTEVIAGLASLAAVVFVTYMIFWMARQAKNLSGELRGRVDALAEKTAVGVAGLAFFAVIREGFETSIFIWSAARVTGDDTNPVLGAVLGLITATVLGYLIYRGAVKLNLSKFFAYTGGFLVIVAAGILAYAAHEFQEIGVLNFLTATAYDLTGVIAPDSTVDSLLRGAFGFRAAPSQLETLLWIAYVIPTGLIFARSTFNKTAKK